jgi:hypothetical protein
MASYTHVSNNGVCIRIVPFKNGRLLYSVHDIMMSLRRCSNAAARHMFKRLVKQQFAQFREAIVPMKLEGCSKATVMMSIDDATRFLFPHFRACACEALIKNVKAYEKTTEHATQCVDSRRAVEVPEFMWCHLDNSKEPAIRFDCFREPLFENWEDWLKF